MADRKKALVRVAVGEATPDLLITNARVLNVFSGEWLDANVAVSDGYIAGVGPYGGSSGAILDAGGRCLVPGFINAHCHMESVMAAPWGYCLEEASHGVTTMIADPHEVANVAGLDGIRFMLAATEGCPVTCLFQLPSCVPATPFEHSGARLDAAALSSLRGAPRVMGLGEMMNYPGVLSLDEKVWDILEAFEGRVCDGHAPLLSGRQLQAYAAAGIHTDHESISWEEAVEKLRAGLAILVREGSASRNLDAIIRGVVAHGTRTDWMAFCTDDKHLEDIRREGSISYCVRRAIALGLPSEQAYAMASINAARIYRLRDTGAIAPGYRADMVLLDDMPGVAIHRVIKAGTPVDAARLHKRTPSAPENSVNLPALDMSFFSLPVPSDGGYPVIEIVPGQIVTRRARIDAGDVEEALRGGKLNRIAVIERHHATGHRAIGLLSGYGLRRGAVASTVGHDSHNLIVVGANAQDMLLAAREIQRIGGGFVYVAEGETLATVPLPLYGLMSEAAPDELIDSLRLMKETLRAGGVCEAIDPMITLSFLALPVIPEIRITDMGIFDVTQFLFVGQKDNTVPMDNHYPASMQSRKKGRKE